MAATTQVRLLVWTQFSHARVHAAGWQQARVLRRANPNPGSTPGVDTVFARSRARGRLAAGARTAQGQPASTGAACDRGNLAILVRGLHVLR